MEQFLLLIIVVLLLAITVTGSLMKIFFRFSHPYATAVTQPIHQAREGRNGIGGFLIVVLLVALAFLTMPLLNIQNTGAAKQDATEIIPQPDHLRVVNQKEPPKVRPHYDEKNNQDEEKPIQVHNRENVYLDIPAKSWKVDRYNMHPDEALPLSFYAIQLEAFSVVENAQEAAEKLSISYKNLFIVYMPNEAGPYKLVIAPFTSREATKFFQKEHRTGGFIRQIDR